MNDLREMVFNNPELLRNVRIQLRPKRMLMAASITAILSLIILPALWSNVGATGRTGWGEQFLITVIVVQGIAILLGGGIACLQSISREKELNTFDYQRITRLSPLELTVGKLLGAPAMAYFIAISLVPAELVGLANSTWRAGDLVDIWILLLFGALAFHSFNLMISMLLKRTPSTGIVLLFLFFAGMPGLSWMTILFARGNHVAAASQVIKFYGVSLPSTPFFSFLYASYAAWFILALERNIKRDPAAYELLTPLQALGFAGWQNVLFIGLTPLAEFGPQSGQMVSIWVNIMIFGALGLVLLRNRDRARRRLREMGERGLSWLEASWPAPYVIIGVIATGLLPLLLMGGNLAGPNAGRIHPEPLNMGLFFFRLTFLALWLSRDLMYLQWMYLRPGRKPLTRAMLYAFVYYSAMFVLFFTRSGSVQPAEAAFQSVFVPGRALVLDAASWSQASPTWLIALASQGVVMLFFAFLCRQELQSLATRPKTYPTAIPPSIRPAAPPVAG
ncbi:MAG: hypothetical protein WB780_16990 [Candidatus Acidiferrales bacterium]